MLAEKLWTLLRCGAALRRSSRRAVAPCLAVVVVLNSAQATRIPRKSVPDTPRAVQR